MSKGNRMKELHQAEELAAKHIEQLRTESLSSYIQWAKSAPQWGYIIDILKDKPELWSKVGDTHRGWLGPSLRYNEEWSKKFPGSVLRDTFPLMLDETHCIRDYYLHRVLAEMKFKNVSREELYETFKSEDAFSQEIFECAPADVFCAYYHIIDMFKRGTIDWSQVYTIKGADERPEEKFEIVFRPMQQEMIDKVVAARAAGRTHLLSYSCPRFGKSACTLGAADALDAQSLLVVSAVASVRDEWRKTVENIENFSDRWVFVDAEMLDADPYIADKLLEEGKRVLVFLTLQDIQGSGVKTRHKGVLAIDFDMMAVDESHIGARGESFAAKLDDTAAEMSVEELTAELSEDDLADIADNKLLVEYVSKCFSYVFSLHLSGTPYNIMMTDEFEPQDIVSQVSYSDILHAKREWAKDHPDAPEWANPYFDFPELLTIGIVMDEGASALLEEMKKLGLGQLTDIFSTDKDKNLVYPELVYKFFAALDGTLPDNGIYALLCDAVVEQRVESFQAVMIFSRRAQVDAVVKWLEENKDRFDNLSKWRFFKATSESKHMKSSQIKDAVDDACAQNINTMTFTVGKMMTGITVKPWNLMINARPSSDMQFYDQSKARILSGYAVDIVIVDPDGTEHPAKQVKKQQSIFIDLVPNRVMEVSAAKAQMRSYAETGTLSTAGVEKTLSYEMEVMPHIVPQVMMDNISTLFVPVTPVDVMKEMSKADAKRSLADQVAFARTVNEEWFDDPVVGQWLDRAVALSKSDEKELLMNAFSSEDGIYSEIDPDDVEGLSGLVDDAQEWAERNTSKLEEQKRELSSKKKAQMTDEEKDKLEKVKQELERIKEIAKAAAVLQKEKLEKQKRLVISLATYVWCAPYDIHCYSDAIRSLGHKYNPSYKTCLGIAHNLGLDAKTLVSVYKAARERDRFELDQIAFRMYDLAHSEELSEMEKIQALFNNFPNIGSNEVVTPLWVCRKMVGALDESVFADCVENGEIITAFSEEVGEFSIAVYLRMQELGYSLDDIKKVVASIPQSPVAYEMTRKTYEMLGLDARNIVSGWGTFDLYGKITEAEEKGGFAYDYKAITETISKTKSGYLCDSTLDRDKAKDYTKMIKFGAIVGNPPYQTPNNGESQGATAIYDEFMDVCWGLSSCTVLITPARFLNGVGVPKKWHRAVMKDEHLRIIEHWANGKGVFAEHDIKGGICITERNMNKNFGAIGTFIAQPELRSITEKVKAKDEEDIRSIIRLQNNLNLDALFADYPELKGKIDRKTLRTNAFERMEQAFTQKKVSSEQVHVYGLVHNKRHERYIDQKYFEEHINLNAWKVLLPEANGTGAIGEILSTPLVGEPLVGHTETFISFGPFAEEEAKNCYKYICSKFARAMLGTRKTTQHNPKATWENVPLQDFTADSDIDWTKSIADIDKQLYKKYGLTDEEIEFIETNVKAMG